MPIVHINMYQGRPVEVKKKLAVAVTEAVFKTLEIKPEAVHVIIHELPKENWATAGILASEKKP
jgi:4-oxalocrotonate tautomerase